MAKMDFDDIQIDGMPEGFDAFGSFEGSGDDEDIEYIDEEMFVELEDEDGNVQECQVVYVTTVADRQFAVLFPVEEEGDEEESTEALILEMLDDETMQSVEDEDLLEAVFEKFKRDNAERFDFE